MAVAKRIIVYILVACLTVSVAVPPVSATSLETNLGDQDFVSLFSPTDEYIVQNGNMTEAELQSVHRVWVSSYGSIKWSVPRDIFAFTVYLTVQVPDSRNFEESMLHVKVNGQEKSLYFIGLYGNEFQYSLSHYDNVYDIEVSCGSADSPVPFTGNFNITDIYTTQLNANPLLYANRYQLNGLCSSKVDGSLYSSTFVSSDPNAADPQFPFSAEKKLNGQEDWGLISGEFEFDVNTRYGGSQYCDRFVFHVKVCGSLTSVGACLVADPNDDSQFQSYLLSDDEIQCYLANGEADYFGSNNMRWPYYYYIIVIDTTGVELAGSYLRVNISIDPVAISNTNKTQTGVYAQVLKAFAFPTRVGEPWYANILGSIKRGFQSIVDKLDEVFNGDSFAADDLENMENQLEELTPTFDDQEIIDNVDNSINEFLPKEELSEIGSLLKDLFYVVPGVYLVLPFTLALVGYLLFGKRS